MSEEKSHIPLAARKKFALVCMALPCGAFIALWLHFYYHPSLFWDGWMIKEGLAGRDIALAFRWALLSFIFTGWLFLAGFRLFQKPCTIFGIFFIVLATLPFLYAVRLGIIYLL